MCIEKTPWEQVIEFHGHTCPGIALGYRVAQIAKRELSISQTSNPAPAILVKAYTHSCAIDAFQIINQATYGRGYLIVEEKKHHVYQFENNKSDKLQITIHSEILEQLADHADDQLSSRERQNKNLEAIRVILGIEESRFCDIQYVKTS